MRDILIKIFTQLNQEITRENNERRTVGGSIISKSRIEILGQTSKAVKAPAKNRQLIRQAIASGAFTNLALRIVAAGGDLEEFT